MDISVNSSASNMMHNAQQKASEAAQKIAQLPIQNDEVGSANYQSTDIIKPIISLKETEFETSAAVKLLEAENKTIGTLLDIKA